MPKHNKKYGDMSITELRTLARARGIVVNAMPRAIRGIAQDDSFTRAKQEVVNDLVAYDERKKGNVSNWIAAGSLLMAIGALTVSVIALNK